MTRPYFYLAKLSLFSAILAGCGGSEADPEAEPGPNDKPTDELSIKLEAFTGGHSKLVWTRHVGGGTGDVHLSYIKHQLWGIDSRDGKGIRQILEETSNYARPMVTPDGESIVFSHKGTEEAGRDKDGKRLKSFDPAVYLTDWKGTPAKKLADGYAVDVWNDPATGIDWVYAATLGQTNRASLYADKLERFQLKDPSVRELVWDDTQLSTENIQLSEDGKRASALFPWPDAGVLMLDSGNNRINEFGCWPALAPDNSYRAWVFDGAHKNLRMFDDSGEKLNRVAVNTGPGLEGHEIYHPRWSNQVDFMTLSGPYKGETVSKSNSKEVEVYIGKFNEQFDEIADWFQLTDNEESDYAPDLWVASGVVDHEVTTDASEGAASTKPRKRAWPVTTGRLLFVWENRKGSNMADLKVGPKSKTKVFAREQARYGRHFDMLCDGGYFDVEEETNAKVEAHLGLPRFKFTLEAMATPFSSDQDGAVISTKAFQVQQRGGDFILVTTRPSPAAYWIGTAKAGEPFHLGVIFNGLEYQIYHNGQLVQQADSKKFEPEMLAAREGLTFGEGWNGALEGVSLLPGELEEFRVERGADYLLAKLENRKPVKRVRLKGKLIEMSPDFPVSALGEYRRVLSSYLYEVEEVLEGEFEEDKVIVLHWTILNVRALESFPRRPGQSYELLIEPWFDGGVEVHPELDGERMNDNLSEFLDKWYDVATPQD